MNAVAPVGKDAMPRHVGLIINTFGSFDCIIPKLAFLPCWWKLHLQGNRYIGSRPMQDGLGINSDRLNIPEISDYYGCEHPTMFMLQTA